MKKAMFSITAIIVALAFWFFDASIHYFAYGEPEFEFFPSEFNELWMRITIVSLIFLFGVFADFYSRKMLIAQQNAEALRIYNSMLWATHHVLNNLLNQMQIMRLEATKSADFDQDVIVLYDNAIAEAEGLIKKLSEIENVSEETIKGSVSPESFVTSANRTRTGLPQ